MVVIDLHGSPYEQGLQHGMALKESIGHNLRVYFKRFNDALGLPKKEILARAALFAPLLAGHNRDYEAAVRGVAEGSGLPLEEIIALNIRYEIIYFGLGAHAYADGCTAFALSPERTASGELLLGQNWDWLPDTQGALLRSREGDLETLAFTEAGIVGGKIGLNSAGLGLCINGLTSMADNPQPSSKPFHVRLYEILRQRTLEDALAVIHEDCGFSGNFLLAQAPDRIVNIEASPTCKNPLEPIRGLLVHANHFLDPEGVGVKEPPHGLRHVSCHRHDTLQARLEAEETHTLETLQAALRDHSGYPNSVCRHADLSDDPAHHYKTVVSVIMNLTQGSLHITDGLPCEGDYETHRLETSLTVAH